MQRRSFARTIAVFAAGTLCGMVLLSPAGAHVGGTVGHLWREHIKPRVLKQHYTKSQSNDRYFTRSQAHARFLDEGDLTNVITSLTESGYGPSVAIGQDGRPIIAFYVSDEFRVAHCNDGTCSSMTTTVLDSFSGFQNGAATTSIAIGTDGRALISYSDIDDSDLMVAHCSDVACTSATTTPIDGDAGDVGQNSSLTIGADGLGLISYHDADNGWLKVAHCATVACTTATTDTVDDSVLVDVQSSIAIGSDDRALIAYTEVSTALRVAHCSNVSCTDATVTPIVTEGAFFDSPSVAIGSDGRGLISYRNYGDDVVGVAHCSNLACTAATSVDVAPVGPVGGEGSIVMAPDGRATISFWDDVTGDLDVVRCLNVLCTKHRATKADELGDVGRVSDSVIAPDGLPLIVYLAETGGLRLLHCGEPGCGALFFDRS